MRGIVDLFAAYERALIRMRTKAALSVKRRRGEWTGSTPFGHRVDISDGVKRLTPDSGEQQALGLIRGFVLDGLTPTQIARRLEEEGVPCRGSRWHKTTVTRILAREGKNVENS